MEVATSIFRSAFQVFESAIPHLPTVNQVAHTFLVLVALSFVGGLWSKVQGYFKWIQGVSWMFDKIMRRPITFLIKSSGNHPLPMSNTMSMLWNLVAWGLFAFYGPPGIVVAIFIPLLLFGHFRIMSAYALAIGSRLLLELAASELNDRLDPRLGPLRQMIEVDRNSCIALFFLYHLWPVLKRVKIRSLTNKYYLYTIIFPFYICGLAYWKVPATFHVDLMTLTLNSFLIGPWSLNLYNIFHKFDHISEPLYSFHKSHHFSVNENGGDNGTIPMSDVVVLLSWKMFSKPPLIGFLSGIFADAHNFQTNVHVEMHNIHHSFHADNFVVPAVPFLEPYFRQSMNQREFISAADTIALEARKTFTAGESMTLKQLSERQKPWKRLWKELFDVPSSVSERIETLKAKGAKVEKED